MIYHQTKTQHISTDQLIDALLLKHNPTATVSLYFENNPHIATLKDAIEIIDKKRKTLSDPFGHTFLCLTLSYESSHSIEAITEMTDTIAHAINNYFGDDLFISSHVYIDENQAIHPTIIISNIERSLSEPSMQELPPNILHNIISKNLPDFYVPAIFRQAVFIFDGAVNALPYKGVVHLICYPKYSPGSQHLNSPCDYYRDID